MLYENGVQLWKIKEIVINLLDKWLTDCEDAGPRGPVGLRNPFTPEEIARAGIHPIILLHALLLFGPGDILAPDPPELEILIASTGHDNVTSRAKSAKQNARLMSVSNLGDTFEGRIGMDHDRIGRISMSGENLLSVRRPVECGDL